MLIEEGISIDGAKVRVHSQRLRIDVQNAGVVCEKRDVTMLAVRAECQRVGRRCRESADLLQRRSPENIDKIVIY